MYSNFRLSHISYQVGTVREDANVGDDHIYSVHAFFDIYTSYVPAALTTDSIFTR